MPLKAIPPGARKGYPFYIFRGTVNGRQREIRTELPAGTPAKSLRQALDHAERELWATDEASRVPRPGEGITFRRAAELYIAWRSPSRQDCRNIERLYPELGAKMVADIMPADIISAANVLYPALKPISKNRLAVKPAAIVIHYAAKNQWCPWLRVQPFKEPRPQTRSVSDATVDLLLRTVQKGRKHLMLLWLFRMGDRVSDPLRVRWDDINLPRQMVRMNIAKTDTWKDRPLHPEVFEALAAIPEAERDGYLFPWRYRTGVHRWLKPLAASLGIKFTAHMARHTLGRQLNENGEGLKTIMAVLGHVDPHSSIRYQDADTDVVRRALTRIGKPVKTEVSRAETGLVLPKEKKT